MSCGAEMRLVRVDRNDTPGLAGQERQTFHCPACDEVETRTVVRPTPPATEPPALTKAERAGGMLQRPVQ
jgi:hypothetical protein